MPMACGGNRDKLTCGVGVAACGINRLVVEWMASAGLRSFRVRAGEGCERGRVGLPSC